MIIEFLILAGYVSGPDRALSQRRQDLIFDELGVGLRVFVKAVLERILDQGVERCLVRRQGSDLGKLTRQIN